MHTPAPPTTIRTAAPFSTSHQNTSIHAPTTHSLSERERGEPGRGAEGRGLEGEGLRRRRTGGKGREHAHTHAPHSTTHTCPQAHTITHPTSVGTRIDAKHDCFSHTPESLTADLSLTASKEPCCSSSARARREFIQYRQGCLPNSSKSVKATSPKVSRTIRSNFCCHAFVQQCLPSRGSHPLAWSVTMHPHLPFVAASHTTLLPALLTRHCSVY